MEFGFKDGGEHFYGHINEYLYHALPLIWKKEESKEESKEIYDRIKTLKEPKPE